MIVNVRSARRDCPDLGDTAAGRRVRTPAGIVLSSGCYRLIVITGAPPRGERGGIFCPDWPGGRGMSYLPGMMVARDRAGACPAPASRCRPGACCRVRRDPGVMVARFKVPDGWTVQAFTFALDCTPGQAACLRRQFGGRRYARNWAVRTLKNDLDTVPGGRPGDGASRPWLRCASGGTRSRTPSAPTGRPVRRGGRRSARRRSPTASRAAVDGYWNWQSSRAGKRAGRRAGFPRFAKKGRDRDRVTFTTGAIRVEPDRRHVTLPRVGTVRVHENTRRLRTAPGEGPGADSGGHGVTEGDPADRGVPGPGPAPPAGGPGRPWLAGRGRRRRTGARHRR